MYSYNVIIISSIAELREKSEDWDDLLKRSSVNIPLARAELVAQWVEQFANKSIFRALIVEYRGRFIASLPIVGTRKGRIILAGINPSNEWAQSGQLLIDFQEDTFTAINLIIDNFEKLPFSIFWFDFIRSDDPEWVLFKKVLCSRKINSHWLIRYSTALVDVESNFDVMISKCDKKSISNVQKRIKKFYKNIEFDFLCLTNRDEILNSLNDCFDLENKGWKGGNSGGSIIKRGLEGFFHTQASLLCSHDEIILFLLKYNSKIISFEYAICSNNTLYMMKTSYDPNFKNISPGQVLRYLIIVNYCVSTQIRRIDFIGEFMPHQKMWKPHKCNNSQVVIPLSSLHGIIFFYLYDKLMPLARKLKFRFISFLKF